MNVVHVAAANRGQVWMYTHRFMSTATKKDPAWMELDDTI